MPGWPVPPVGPGVCCVCHGPARDGRSVCWCCRRVGTALADAVVPTVVPVSLFRSGDAMHRVLRRYKDAPSVAARRYHASIMTGILDGFLATHAACLRRRLGVWDTVAVVPSARRRSAGSPSPRPGLHVPEPFDVVVDASRTLAGVPRLRLLVGSTPAGHLRPSPDAFAVDSDGRGRRVLVVDDTWTTGAHARSAAAAISRVGASVAGVVVVGRVINPQMAVGVDQWWDRVVANRARDGAGSGPDLAWQSPVVGPCCIHGRSC